MATTPAQTTILTKSSGPSNSSPNQIESPANNNGDGTTTTRKKKKKKTGSKTERQLKREEEKLRALYGPKDSHVKLISASVLQKLQQGNKSTINNNQKSSNIFFIPEDFPSFTSQTVNSSSPSSRTTKPSTLNDHFPALTSSDPVTNNDKKTVVEKNQVESVNQETDVENKSSLPNNQDKSNPSKDSSNKEVQQHSSLEGPTFSPSKKISDSITSGSGSSKKKFKKPIIISLDDLIVKKTTGKEMAKTKVKKRTDDMTKRYSNNLTIGNTLDSSGPMFIHRGKMREKPKKKKPTKLKMAILKSRSIRLEEKSSTQPSPEEENIPVISNERLSDDQTTILSTENSNPELTTNNNNKECETSEGDSQLQVINEENPVAKSESGSSIEDIKENDNIFATLINSAIKGNEEIVEDRRSSFSLDVSSEVMAKAKESLHTRKFRPYCDMYLSKELHGHVIVLLKELHRFQDRLYHSDPIKYKTKRRFIHGIKDTANNLKISKVVLIIFAPDIESSNAEGGLDEKIEEIKGIAKEKNVPVIFSGNRFVLGKPIFCKTAVSVISILDRQGAENLYFKVVEEADKLREKYQMDLLQKIQEIQSLQS